MAHFEYSLLKGVTIFKIHSHFYHKTLYDHRYPNLNKPPQTIKQDILTTYEHQQSQRFINATPN